VLEYTELVTIRLFLMNGGKRAEFPQKSMFIVLRMQKLYGIGLNENKLSGGPQWRLYVYITEPIKTS